MHQVFYRNREKGMSDNRVVDLNNKSFSLEAVDITKCFADKVNLLF